MNLGPLHWESAEPSHWTAWKFLMKLFDIRHFEKFEFTKECAVIKMFIVYLWVCITRSSWKKVLSLLSLVGNSVAWLKGCDKDSYMKSGWLRILCECCSIYVSMTWSGKHSFCKNLTKQSHFVHSREKEAMWFLVFSCRFYIKFSVGWDYICGDEVTGLSWNRPQI